MLLQSCVSPLVCSSDSCDEKAHDLAGEAIAIDPGENPGWSSHTHPCTDPLLFSLVVVGWDGEKGNGEEAQRQDKLNMKLYHPREGLFQNMSHPGIDVS